MVRCRCVRSGKRYVFRAGTLCMLQTTPVAICPNKLSILRRVARVQLRQRHLASDLSSLDSWIALSARRLVLNCPGARLLSYHRRTAAFHYSSSSRCSLTPKLIRKSVMLTIAIVNVEFWPRGGSDHGIANHLSRPMAAGRQTPPFSTRVGSGRSPGLAQLRRFDLRLPSNGLEGSRPMGDSRACGSPQST